MKQLMIIVYFLTILTAFSCYKKSGQKIDKTNTTVSTIKNIVDQEPVKTVKEFLKWYRDNEKRLGTFGMVNNCSTIYDSTKYYSVNFKSTEKYLTEMKKSGFISDKYINKWRQYFKKCETDFKNNPQFDGPPEGFEYNFVMWSQEYEEDLANIDKSKIIKQKIDRNKSNLTLEFPSNTKLIYWLTNENNKWFIDDIENEHTPHTGL